MNRPFVGTEADAVEASAISTSSSSLSSDPEPDSESEAESSLSEELSFLAPFTPGSGSEDSSDPSDSLNCLRETAFLATGFDVGNGALSESSSEDSSLEPELDFDFAPVFTAEAFAVAGFVKVGFVRADALAASFADTGFAGASSDDSSDSSSLDSPLELDSAAAAGAFGGGAFPEVGLGSVALEAALPSAALAGAGLTTAFDGFSESEQSELSLLWLILTALLETLTGAFEGTAFAVALEANFGDSSSESLSPDSEDESLLAESFFEIAFL